MGDGCLALIKLCVAGAAMKKSPDLDLDRAPYVLYGVKYIDLVSLAHPFSEIARPAPRPRHRVRARLDRVIGV